MSFWIGITGVVEIVCRFVYSLSKKAWSAYEEKPAKGFHAFLRRCVSWYDRLVHITTPSIEKEVSSTINFYQF